MKNKFTILLIFLFVNNYFAQKENNHWFITSSSLTSTHVDFNPVPATINLVNIPGGTSISTPQGNLMFHTNGNTVFDKNGNVMPNGDNLTDYGLTIYSVIVPKPGSCAEFYVISSGFSCVNYLFPYYGVDCSTNDPNNENYGKDEGLKYSLVNLDDNGDGLYDSATELGTVVSNQKNISIPEPTGNKAVTVVRHSNGVDYWLIAGDVGTDKFHVYKVSNAGIIEAQTPYNEQNLGNNLKISLYSQLKANKQGNKLVTNTLTPNPGSINFPVFPLLLDFNNSTGQITNPIVITENPSTFCSYSPCPYGNLESFEFSPDGSQLYFTDGSNLIQMQIAPTIQPPTYIGEYDLIPGKIVSFGDVAITPEIPPRILVNIQEESPLSGNLLPMIAVTDANIGGNSNIQMSALTTSLTLGSFFPRFVEGGGVWPKDNSCFYSDCPQPAFQPFLPAVPDLFPLNVQAELTSSLYQEVDKEFDDLDNDGDIDILYMKDSQLHVLRNTAGAGQVPNFSVPGDPFILNFPAIPVDPMQPNNEVYVDSFRLFDWDNDGDKDLVVIAGKLGHANRLAGGVFLFVNDGNGNFSGPPTMLLNAMSYGDAVGHDTSNDFPLEYFQFLEVGDLNNDGLPDLLISGKARISGTAYFENTGTLANPSFSLVAPQVIVPSTLNLYDTWIQNIAFPQEPGSLQMPELFPAGCSDNLDLFISNPMWENSNNYGGGRVYFHENNGGMTTGTLPDINIAGLKDQFGFNDDPDAIYPNSTFPNLTESPLKCKYVVVRFVDYFGTGCPITIMYNDCTKEFFYRQQNCGNLSATDTSALQNNANKITLFPNPANGIVNYKVSGDLKIKTVALFDSSGKFIKQPKIINQQINIHNLNTGIYFVNFLTDKGLISAKLIVN